MLLPCLLTSLTDAFLSWCFLLIEQKQTTTWYWKPVYLLGIVFLWLCIVSKKVPMQAFNEMKSLKYRAFGGNCCTLVHLQFVFITPLNDFFNNIPLKNSVHYIVYFIREINWWVCRSAVMENIFEKKKNIRKWKREKAIISREELAAFLFWSLLHIQPGCDYSQFVLSDNRSQMHHHSFFFFFSFSFSFFYSKLFLGSRERDGVYLILLCWHTRLGSDKRASGAALIQISACSQWIGAGKGNKIQRDNLSGEGERTVLHSVSQPCYTRWGIF